MRAAIHTFLLLHAFRLSGAAACAQHVEGGHGAAPGKPDELFRSRCISCHAPPDARFAVERAWLGQVLDTA